MKKYDKIKVPVTVASDENWVTKTNVIVMTVDEAESLWAVAEKNGEILGLQNIEYMLEEETTDCETYLKSKGIVYEQD